MFNICFDDDMRVTEKPIFSYPWYLRPFFWNQITYTDRQVDDDLTQRLYQYFTEDEIVELTGLIAFQNLSSKFNSALDLPVQGFCRLPESTDRNNGKSNV